MSTRSCWRQTTRAASRYAGAPGAPELLSQPQFLAPASAPQPLAVGLVTAPPSASRKGVPLWAAAAGGLVGVAVAAAEDPRALFKRPLARLGDVTLADATRALAKQVKAQHAKQCGGKHHDRTDEPSGLRKGQWQRKNADSHYDIR